MFRKFLIFIALMSLVPLSLGFTGRLLPFGESLAAFRFPNLLAASVLVFALRQTKFFYAALALICLSAVSVAIYFVPQKMNDQDVYRIYQKNLSFRIKHTEDLKADILASNSDFITLQEVTKKNLTFISEMEAHFPYHHACPFSGVGGVAVMSRWPSTGEAKCFNNDGMSAMKVETPAGSMWLVSVHTYWPFPYGQAEQVEILANHLKDLKGPKIIAGDFNMVPWSHSLKSFEHASDTQMTRPAIHSFTLPYIPMTIPIDHILLPSGAKAKTAKHQKLGSDHFGVVAEFNLP